MADPPRALRRIDTHKILATIDKLGTADSARNPRAASAVAVKGFVIVSARTAFLRSYPLRRSRFTARRSLVNLSSAAASSSLTAVDPSEPIDARPSAACATPRDHCRARHDVFARVETSAASFSIRAAAHPPIAAPARVMRSLPTDENGSKERRSPRICTAPRRSRRLFTGSVASAV